MKTHLNIGSAALPALLDKLQAAHIGVAALQRALETVFLGARSARGPISDRRRRQQVQAARLEKQLERHKSLFALGPRSTHTAAFGEPSTADIGVAADALNEQAIDAAFRRMRRDVVDLKQLVNEAALADRAGALVGAGSTKIEGDHLSGPERDLLAQHTIGGFVDVMHGLNFTLQEIAVLVLSAGDGKGLLPEHASRTRDRKLDVDKVRTYAETLKKQRQQHRRRARTGTSASKS